MAFACLRRLDFIGWNLTLPHKIAGYDLVDRLDPEAEALGAINTVVNRDGALIGFNTDGRGLRAALTDAFGIDPARPGSHSWELAAALGRHRRGS